MDSSRGEPWIEYLTEAECRHLLSLHRVGRVGVVVHHSPEIYPVNYALDGEAVVFRTDPGNKLRGVDSGAPVCFEVDGLDFEHETGWSVLVKGHGAEVSADDVDERTRDELRLWSLGDKAHWVRITPDEITGRRLRRHGDGSAPS